MESGENLSLITVITVCYNSAGTIRRAFDSILQQTYKCIDYVVIDGSSSDGTIDILKQYEEAFDSRGIRYRWISEPDEGIYDAMNKGIAMAQGDIIGTLNSDDFYEPHTLQVIAAAFKKHPDVGIFYGLLRILRAGKELQIYRYRYENYLLDLEMEIYSATQHPTCFVFRDVYHQIGVFDISFSVAADYDFLIRAMQSSIKFYPLDVVLSNFSWGGISVRMTENDRLKQRNAVLYKNNLLSEDEYRKRQKRLKYTKYKFIKERLVQWLFG